MAKQATGIFDYVSPSGRTFFNKGRQYTSPTPQRSGKTIDPSPLIGKPAAGGAPLASRQVAAPIQEAGPEAMSITDNIAATQPQMVTETQQPIENRGGSARYMIQGGGPKIDLSFLVPERANKSFDPSKAIGGENLPFQESKGVGGFFRRMLGDESNQQNIAAQQAQGAEWRQDAKAEKERQAKKEDLADEIRLRMESDRTLKKEDREFTAEQNKAMREFTGSQNNLDRTLRQGESQADRDTRVALAEKENNASWRRLETELGFRKGESAADRAFRSSEGAADRAFRTGESQADRAARLSEGEANRALTAAHYNLVREDNAADRGLRANEGAANRALTAAQQNLVREDNEANRTLRANEGAAGRAIDEARLGLQRDGQAGDQAYRAGEVQYRRRANVERLGDNVYQNEKGEIFEHTPGMPGFGKNKGTPGGFRRLTMPGAMAPKGGGGGQVDRGTGATLGGPLPPGEGVRISGALPPPPMTQAAPAVVTQPRSATLADTLVNLPGMGAALDMGYYMTPERTARLEESKRQQLADRLKRNQEMLDYNARDLGPSAF